MKKPNTGEEFTVEEVALHMRRVLNEVAFLHPETTLIGRMAKVVVDQYDDLPSSAETPNGGNR